MSTTRRPIVARKRSKYRAVTTVVDGIRFASKAEARRWGELKLMQEQGLITALYVQRSIPLEVGGLKIGSYRPDFDYRDSKGKHVVEDVKGGSKKGTRTPLYRWKAKHLAAQYGIDITEVYYT